MDFSNIKTTLLLSNDVEIGDNILFTQPKIKDIINRGYYSFIKNVYFFYNPKDIYIESKKLYDYFEENGMNNYAVLSYILDNDKESVEIIKQFMTDHIKNSSIEISGGKIYIDERIISESLYNDICDVAKICYDFDGRLDDQNWDKTGKKMKVNLVRMQRKQLHRMKDKENKENNEDGETNNTLYKILSVVTTRREIEDILKMTMYQLTAYYKTINNEKVYEAMLQGIYSGTVDSKKYKNIWVGDE